MSFEEDILIEQYLKGELSDIEQASFSERLTTDAEFREKVDFERQLFETLNGETWSFAESENSPESEEYKALFRSEEVNAVKATITEVNDRYQKNEKFRRLSKWFLYPLAAAIAFFAAFYLLTPSSKSTQELYFTYLEKSEGPSLNTRGQEDVNQALVIAESYFENEEYSKAASSFTEVLATGYQDGSLYIGLSISQLKLERFGEAELTLNQFINSDLIDGEKGYWFKALLFLARDEPTKTISILQSIIDKEYFNMDLAKELLEELK